MNTALFILRAQPLHKGHVHAIKHLMKKYKVIVALGSINKKDSKNPFSYAARKKMLGSVFKNIRIIGVKDISSDKEWKASVENKAKFDVLVTGNQWVRKCFRGYRTEKPVFLNLEEYDASEIRKLMKKGKKWEYLVPRSVADIIKAEVMNS